MKPFEDGAELCSPGRWKPDRRCNDSRLNMAKQVRLGLILLLSGSLDIKNTLHRLACKQFSSSPFTGDLVLKGRELIFFTLRKFCAPLPLEEVPSGQPIFLAMLVAFLKISGDPDHRCFFSSSRSFGKGVSLGVIHKLPRVPAVFARKVRWRQYEPQDEAQDKDNYHSAVEHAGEILAQFEEEEKLGAMRGG